MKNPEVPLIDVDATTANEIKVMERIVTLSMTNEGDCSSTVQQLLLALYRRYGEDILTQIEEKNLSVDSLLDILHRSGDDLSLIYQRIVAISSIDSV